jgi:hypothetical protein
MVAAQAARAIAARYPNMDPDRAYVQGLLHDIGRGSGGPRVPDVRHILDGYRLMLDLGFEECGRTCLTHSFPIKQADAFASGWDCPHEEKRFVQDFLDRVEYTPYDELVQLCDAISLPAGPCVMEKRLVDVALRHGVNPLTLAKWKAYLALERRFSEAVGGSIYRLLPGVIENTLGLVTNSGAS